MPKTDPDLGNKYKCPVFNPKLLTIARIKKTTNKTGKNKQMSTPKVGKSELFGNYFKTAMKKCFNVET